MKNCEIIEYKAYNGDVFLFPENKAQKFSAWLKEYDSGLIKKILKLKEWRGLHFLYTSTRIAQQRKREFNSNRKNIARGERYDMERFLLLLRSLAKVEMRDNHGNAVHGIGSRTNIKDLEIRVTGISPFEWLQQITTREEII